MRVLTMTTLPSIAIGCVGVDVTSSTPVVLVIDRYRRRRNNPAAWLVLDSCPGRDAPRANYRCPAPGAPVPAPPFRQP